METQRNERLWQHLLRQQIAAESDTATECYGSEVRALRAFAISPRFQGWHHFGSRDADKAEQAIVRANGAKVAAIFRTVRAKLQQLHDARKIFRSGRRGDSSDFLDLNGQRYLGGSSD